MTRVDRGCGLGPPFARRRPAAQHVGQGTEIPRFLYPSSGLRIPADLLGREGRFRRGISVPLRQERSALPQEPCARSRASWRGLATWLPAAGPTRRCRSSGCWRGRVRGRHSPRHRKSMTRTKHSAMTGTAELNTMIDRVAPDILELLADDVPRTKGAIVEALAGRHDA